MALRLLDSDIATTSNTLETNRAFTPLKSPKKSKNQQVPLMLSEDETPGCTVRLAVPQKPPQLSQLLKTANPVSSQPTTISKVAGQVLTSADSSVELEEKERLKAEEDKQKTER